MIIIKKESFRKFSFLISKRKRIKRRTDFYNFEIQCFEEERFEHELGRKKSCLGGLERGLFTLKGGVLGLMMMGGRDWSWHIESRFDIHRNGRGGNERRSAGHSNGGRFNTAGRDM